MDDVLRSLVIPALTGRPPPNDLECDLFALPARLGGLGIGIPSKKAEREFSASLTICKALTELILSPDDDYSYEVMSNQIKAKTDVHKQSNEQSTADSDHQATQATQLPDTLRRAMNLAREKGSSIWLTSLPL